MHSWLIYLLESGLCLAGFFLIYLLFLRKMTWFRWNRTFLLAGILLSATLPVGEWEVSWLEQESAIMDSGGGFTEMNALPVAPMQAEPVPVAGADSPMPVVVSPEPVPQSNPAWTWSQLLFGLWAVGALVVLVRLCLRSVRLWQIARRRPRGSVVPMPAGSGSFTFAGRIFLDDHGLRADERTMVIDHERAHLLAGHGWDNLLLELSGIVWWFHPVLPFWRRALRTLHEFQADAAAAAQSDPLGYSRLILRLAGRRTKRMPAAAFASSKAGTRIDMLHQRPSSPMSKLKYLLFLPLMAAFMYSFVLVPAEPTSAEAGVGTQFEFAGEAVPLEKPHVQSQIEAILKKIKTSRTHSIKAMKRAEEWKGRIVPILQEEGIPVDFFYLAVSESLLNNEAESSYGAMGMWQFMPQTARQCGLTVNDKVDERKDWKLATKAACRYLRDTHRELGNWTATAVAYNKGLPGYRKLLKAKGVDSYYDIEDKKENYLYRVLAYKQLLTEEFEMKPQPAGGLGLSNPPYIRPLKSHSSVKVTSSFGETKDPFSGKMRLHKGIDMSAPQGTPVHAPAGGRVEKVGEDATHGKFLIIRHDDVYITRYNHLDDVIVTQGSKIAPRQVIAHVGSTGRSTGAHLHYEVHKNGEPVDPAGCFSKPQGNHFYSLPEVNGDC